MTAAAAIPHETPKRVATLMHRATYASLVVAGSMVAIKLAAWLATDSVSLLSSLLDSLLDTAAALINLMAVREALAPADQEHRFGHGKAEPLAALGQAAFIAGSVVLLLIQALHHLLSPVEITHALPGIGVMVFAIAVSLGLLAYQRYVVRRTGSLVISSDALHYRADLVLNASVIASLLLTMQFGWRFIDPLCGGAIALWIIYGAWTVARQALVQLMDHELPDDERARIRRIALSNPEVRAVHDLRTRAAGPTSFIQIHLEMDGGISLNDAHRISDAVEADILDAYPNAEVLIHQDPEGLEEPPVFPARR